MLPESQHDYHARRARDELDLAYRAEARPIMEAHLRLSALHMAELTRIARERAPIRNAFALAAAAQGARIAVTGRRTAIC